MACGFRIAVILMVASFSASDLAASAKQGSICVAPLPVKARESDHDYPEGKAPREFTYNFAIRVDDRKGVALPTHAAIRIDALELRRKHRVRISDGNRTIESFSFTFEARGSRNLCLSYTPWYQTWSLEPPGLRPWCNCK
jgi:hypothetical protein